MRPFHVSIIYNVVDTQMPFHLKYYIYNVVFYTPALIRQNNSYELKGKKISKNMSSPAGNRTPVSRVTGGDTDHYTTEELQQTPKFLVLIGISIRY